MSFKPLGLRSALAVVLAAASLAGAAPPGISPDTLPWENSKYSGYQEPSGAAAAIPSSTEPLGRFPHVYTLRIVPLSQKHQYDSKDSALLIAHLPEDAAFFLQDQPTTQTGGLREYLTPALEPGSKYAYKVRVRWREKGKWVEQVAVVRVQAGEAYAIDVVPVKSDAIIMNIAASMAQLSREDEMLAEWQKYCPVQEGTPLGAMGLPVKVMVNGKPIFVCCAACEEAVRKDPDLYFGKVEQLRAKSNAQALK